MTKHEVAAVKPFFSNPLNKLKAWDLWNRLLSALERIGLFDKAISYMTGREPVTIIVAGFSNSFVIFRLLELYCEAATANKPIFFNAVPNSMSQTKQFNLNNLILGVLEFKI